MQKMPHSSKPYTLFCPRGDIKMDEYQHEQIESAFLVLNDMMDTFEQWYPQHYDFLPEEEQEHLSKAEMEEAKEQFAHTKLMLELGEYRSDDYDYLKWLQDRVLDNEQYFEALNIFIYALSEEYGPV
jgi:hypothetical protein